MKTHKKIEEVGNVQKRCNKCHSILQPYMFVKNNQQKDGLSLTCKKCLAVIRKQKVAKMCIIWESQNDSTMKTCKKCGVEKSITMFHKQPTSIDGREGSCLDCRNYNISKSHQILMDKMSKEEQFIYKKSLRISRKYNMSIDELDDRVKFQNNSCAICFKQFDNYNRLYIDHDHKCCQSEKTCGQCNRGLLCKKCNFAIGLFDDSPEIIHSAKLYLERWENGIFNISH